ncbi:hypothetical protein Tco_0011438 [Tanacetum coccineum]
MIVGGHDDGGIAQNSMLYDTSTVQEQCSDTVPRTCKLVRHEDGGCTARCLERRKMISEAHPSPVLKLVSSMDHQDLEDEGPPRGWDSKYDEGPPPGWDSKCQPEPQLQMARPTTPHSDKGYEILLSDLVLVRDNSKARTQHD